MDKPEEGVQQPDCSHNFLPSPIIKEGSEKHEEVKSELCQDFMNQSLLDEFLEEEVCLSPSCQIYSGDPIYDSYEFESDESCEKDHTQPILTVEGLLSFPNIDMQEGIPHDFQEVSFDFHSDEVSNKLHDIEIKVDEHAYVQTKDILQQQVSFQNEKDLIDLLAVDSVQWKFLDQMQIGLDFYDLVSDRMDSFSESVSHFAVVCMMSMDHRCEYTFLFHPFLKTLQHYHFLLYSCRKDWFMISWLRVWLHWKSSFT